MFVVSRKTGKKVTLNMEIVQQNDLIVLEYKNTPEGHMLQSVLEHIRKTINLHHTFCCT